MGAMQDLARRAVGWSNDAAELDKIMADMSASCEAYVNDVQDSAKTLLLNARLGFNGGLSEYQSAMCHVYIARGGSTNSHSEAFHEIQQASDHLETLREAFKPLARLGLKEHPQIEELSKHIADLRSIWDEVKPVEVPLHEQFRAPSLGQAQWLIGHMLPPYTMSVDGMAWSMVNHLGASPTYNTKPLWTYQAGPTAAGLLSDSTYRLLNLMNRSRLPEGEGLDSGILMKEHILDRKLQREKSLDQQLQSESSTDGASTIPGSRDTNESLTTLSKISVPRDVSDIASDNLHSSESGSESDSVHTVIRNPTRAPIEEHTTPISNIDIQDKNSPLAKPTNDDVGSQAHNSDAAATTDWKKYNDQNYDPALAAQVLKARSTAYDVCYQLYDEDKLEECIESAESQLGDSSIPFYDRMLFELLLAACLDDLWEAKDALDRCDSIWHLCNPDESNQEALREIRELLDGLRADLALELHAMEDPRIPHQESGDEDDDVVAGYEVDKEYEAEEEDEEKAEDDEDGKDEKLEDVTTQTGETTKVDCNVEPGVERTPPEIVEVEEVKSLAEPLSKASVDDVGVKTGMGLLSEISQLLREIDTGNTTVSADADTLTATTGRTAPILP